MANAIKYRVQTGSLPTGVTLNEDSGRFIGTPTWAALGAGPTFSTPVNPNLGTFNAGDTVNTVLAFAPPSGKTATIGLVNSGLGLPWGLVLNPDTGALTGTLVAVRPQQVLAQESLNGPTWVTEFGKVADLEEGGATNVTLSATPFTGRTVDKFVVINGGLPWGLVLDSATGTISGNAADLKNPGLTIESPKLPLPVWNTTIGTLGIVNELDSVYYSLSVTPAPGRTISKFTLRDGGLPWGTTLDTVSGEIIGTIAELRVYGDPEFFEGGKDPQFTNIVKINTVDTTVLAQGSLGNFTKGNAVNIQFNVTPYAGRTMARYTLALGTLPWGLSLDISTGIISGTISSTRALSGTYTITIRGIDSAQAFANRTYTLTVL